MATAEMEIGHAPEMPPTDPVELDLFIDWKLRRIQEMKAQQAHNSAVVKAEIEKLREWADSENHILQNSIDWFEEQVIQVARAYNFGSKKSRRLPHGTFGKRITPATITVVDEAAMLAFAKSNQIPVKVKESVAIADLKEYVNSSGMLPDGVENVPEVEKFYVTVEVPNA